MKTIFDPSTRDEVIRRISALNENQTAQWGKMNLFQMLTHCTLFEEMMQGKKQYKRAFVGRLFGKMALRQVLKDDAPLRHSTPTLAELTVREAGGNIHAQKEKWIARIEAYAHYGDSNLIHVFFGKMSREQIGQMVYKHIDHHLRQFNG